MTGRRPRLDPATARIRNALRTHCRPADTGPVIVAVSGGADSLALAAAAAFLHRRGEGRFLACTVDHGLQPGSAEVAARVVARLEALGLPATSVTTDVDTNHPGGLEAAARTGRYSALARVASSTLAADILAEVGISAAASRRSDSTAHPAAPTPAVIPRVLTGHTRDDQAETVLLGLLRGSGARSLSGMAPCTRFDTANGPIEIVRPLLAVTRQETRESCAAQGLEVWDDPMNDDTRFTRVRARRMLETLSESLGQDPRAGLARTADLLREDADHLDAEAAAAWADLRASGQGATPAQEVPGERVESSPRRRQRDGADGEAGSSTPASLAVRDLAAFSQAVSSRILRAWLVARGVSAGELTADHVRDVREVAAASGAVRREASVPGGGVVRRTGDRILHVGASGERQGRP